jgi:hypothetical protein
MHFFLTVELPLDWDSFYHKITTLERSDKLRELGTNLLYPWQCVLYNREPRDVYESVLNLYNAVNQIVLPGPETPRKGDFNQDNEDAAGEALLQHWNSPYIGPSYRILRDMIRRYEEENSEIYYTKSIFFVQCSGAGKSRLQIRLANIARWSITPSGETALVFPSGVLRF